MIRLVSSNINLLDFYYTKDIDYYILNVILSEPLGSSILTVEQIDGPTVYLEKISSTVYRYKDPFDKTEVSRTFRATVETEEESNNEREKTYRVPIHRKIAEAALLKESTGNSLLHLEVEEKDKVVINKDYETVIYNIIRKERSVDIYSNTLNISVTDKFYNNKGLYEYKEFLSKEDLDTFKQTLIEYIEEDLILYFNSPYTNSSDYTNRYCIIGNPLTRSSNIKVRKLKDRFKITIKNIDGNLAKINTNSLYLFEPTIYKNYIEFNSSILNINNKQYYIYNNSFNVVDKKEYSLINETKDPLLSFYTYTDNIVSYSSWRSNLLFNEKIDSNYYYYLKLESENKTDLILQTVEKREDPTLLLLFEREYIKTNSKVTWTPFSETVNYVPTGESYTIVDNTVLDKKFNTYNDIKFSTERLLISVEKGVKNKTIYLVDGDTIIYQTNKLDNKEPIPPEPELPISCEGATNDTSCIEFSDTGLYDIYINDVLVKANITVEELKSLQHTDLKVEECKDNTPIDCTPSVASWWTGFLSEGGSVRISYIIDAPQYGVNNKEGEYLETDVVIDPINGTQLQTFYDAFIEHLRTTYSFLKIGESGTTSIHNFMYDINPQPIPGVLTGVHLEGTNGNSKYDPMTITLVETGLVGDLFPVMFPGLSLDKVTIKTCGET